jgi:hypothetical protein
MAGEAAVDSEAWAAIERGIASLERSRVHARITSIEIRVSTKSCARVG